VITEFTATVFVFAQIDEAWNLGLIYHPRLEQWMNPGGHVENENEADAAVREVLEETGRHVELLRPPGLLLPARYPVPEVVRPWWMNELTVPADGHTPEPHIHVDHQYLAIAPQPGPVATPEHPFRWCREADLETLDIVADTKMLAAMLLPQMTRIVGAHGRPLRTGGA
jgi:8-oxo-dGTP pyrophosphatase MutT (NUDIX family)